MVAFEEQRFEIVQVLIAAGADVTRVMNVSDKVSSTSWIRRARSERRSRGDMAKVAHTKHPLSFPPCRVPLLFPCQDRRTPLIVALEGGHPVVARALIEARADATVKSKVSVCPA